ncbi:taste receptor type 2 member 40 [Echinops telfairi]|uniref:Taste receptor type 2 n=1 Tax=Echinops telfairi TaxID=9371 RepID=A0ABM0J3L0_ECHTE|nr:taste receptor type 2 member 40 [Echinops telfairi]
MATVTSDAVDQGAPGLKSLLTLLASGLECAVGVAGNGFIVAVHGAGWAQGRQMPTGDYILLLLSIARLLLQLWVLLESVLSLLWLSVYNQSAVYTLFKVTVVFLDYLNLWLAAWLNVFYCLKIANFTHPWFLVLKRRVSGLMPWLVRLSALLSLGFSFPFSKNVFHVYVNSSVPIPASNTTEKKYFSESNMASLAILYHLGIFLPLVTFILAASLLILSLRRHTLHMWSRATGSGDPSTQAHVGAIKAIGSFLVLYIINSVALFLSMANIFRASGPGDILCKVLVAAYPTGHAGLLILSNPGLRRAWIRLRHRARCCLQGRAP